MLGGSWPVAYVLAHPEVLAGLATTTVDGPIGTRRLDISPDVMKYVWLRLLWARQGTALRAIAQPGNRTQLGLPTPPAVYSTKDASTLREMAYDRDGTERLCLPNDDQLDALVDTVRWAVHYMQALDHRVVPNEPAYLLNHGEVLFRRASATFAFSTAGFCAKPNHIVFNKGQIRIVPRACRSDSACLLTRTADGRARRGLAGCSRRGAC